MREYARLRAVVLVALAGLAAVVVAGCVPARGSGHVITEARAVGETVDRVELSGIGRVEISQADHAALAVDADDNLMRYIKTETVGDTLRISVASGALPFVALSPSTTIVYRLALPQVAGVSVSGSGSIVGDGIQSDGLDVEISGSGDVQLRDLEAADFSYDLSGAGKATVSGTANSVRVSIDGSGRLDAGELRCADAAVNISGSGRAIVWASDRLEVDISGSGDIEYYGSPQVEQHVSGSGSLRSLGSK